VLQKAGVDRGGTCSTTAAGTKPVAAVDAAESRTLLPGPNQILFWSSSPQARW